MKDDAEQKAETIFLKSKLKWVGQWRISLANQEIIIADIAAALREAQQDGYTKGWTAGNEHEDALDAEIAKLKAEAGKP